MNDKKLGNWHIQWDLRRWSIALAIIHVRGEKPNYVFDTPLVINVGYGRMANAFNTWGFWFSWDRPRIGITDSLKPATIHFSVITKRKDELQWK